VILLGIATAIQFVIIIVLAFVVLSLARQVGILHERLSPAGMTRTREGIAVGEVLPPLEVRSVSGVKVMPGRERSGASLLFVAADCPICKSVLPAYEAALGDVPLTAYWVTDGLPGSDGTVPDYEGFAAEHHIDPDRFLVSQELGLKLGIRQIPALAVLDGAGRLTHLEIVNGPRQLAGILADQRASPIGENST
jgi:methylamine dehydrogenase accessory protein MauD